MRYDVYITLLTPAYGEAIAGRLINLGWEVTTFGTDFGLVEDQPDTIGALVLFCIEGEDNTLDDTQTLVKDILKSLGVSYFSIVVTEATPSTWSLGNVKREHKEPVRLTSWDRLGKE